LNFFPFCPKGITVFFLSIKINATDPLKFRKSCAQKLIKVEILGKEKTYFGQRGKGEAAITDNRKGVILGV